jgi:hypothetical protein
MCRRTFPVSDTDGTCMFPVGVFVGSAAADHCSEVVLVELHVGLLA